MESKNNYYPQIEIPRNTNPNRLYAIPLFGFLFKIIILIPVFIEIWLVTIATYIFVMLINPFAVLITGKYMQAGYDLATGIMRLGAKTTFYLFGLTDKYPGFEISAVSFTWNLTQPQSPNKLFAIPLFGFLFRTIVIIPFGIFAQIISYASNVAMFFSFAPVLFNGHYPETTHEITVDGIRLTNASIAYMFGLSDTYPSFKISWNHKTMKIFLIIIAVLILLGNMFSKIDSARKTSQPGIPGTTINVEEIPATEAF